MAQTHYNRDAVLDRLDRLDEEYGIDYREEDELEVDPDEFAERVEAARNGYIGSSYVWIVRTADRAAPLTDSMPAYARDDRDRVLLILHRGGDAWAVPGGGRESEETFEEAAIREVREETAVDCSIADLFGTYHERWTSPEHDETVHFLRVVFEGVYDGGHIAIQPGELNGAAWFASSPKRLHPLAEPVGAEWFELPPGSDDQNT